MKARSDAAYGWCAEVPGDMHAKGYLYEVCKKVMTPGGFMHIVREVLDRKKSLMTVLDRRNFESKI